MTSIRLERWRIKALQEVAAREHRSMAAELRWMIDQRIAEEADPFAEPKKAAA